MVTLLRWTAIAPAEATGVERSEDRVIGVPRRCSEMRCTARVRKGSRSGDASSGSRTPPKTAIASLAESTSIPPSDRARQSPPPHIAVAAGKPSSLKHPFVHVTYRWRHHSVGVVSVYCGTYVICIGTLPASIAMGRRLSPPVGAASGYVVRPLGRCRLWEHAACMVTTTDARHKPHRIYTHKGINAEAIHRFEPATSSDVGWVNGAGSRRLGHRTVGLPDLEADHGTHQATQMRQPSCLGTACDASRRTPFDCTEMLGAIA